MLFFVYLEDFPSNTEVRASIRSAHLYYMAQHEDKIVLGGPVSRDTDSDLNGTVLLVDFPNHQSVTAFLDGDPYCMAGLFAKRTVVAWHPTRVSMRALSKFRPESP